MQYPDSIWEGRPEAPAESNTDAVETMQFLDRMQKEHGDHSVVYVRYATPLTVWSDRGADQEVKLRIGLLPYCETGGD